MLLSYFLDWSCPSIAILLIDILSNHLKCVSLWHVTTVPNKQCKPFKRRGCSTWAEEKEGMWMEMRKREDRGRKEKGEKWREEQRHELTQPAVACFHFSSGTYASLDCLKERPAFPHHLNRLVPLLFHSLKGFSYKTPPPLPPVFLLISASIS